MSDTTVYSVVEFCGKAGRQYGHYTDDEIRKNTGQSFQLGDYDGHVYWMEELQYYSMRICFIGNLEDALDRRAQLEAREMTPKESVKRMEVKQSKATRKRRALLAKVTQLPAPEEEQLEDVADVKEDDENMDLEDNGTEKEGNGEDRENEETEEAAIELEDDEKRPENMEDEIAPIVDTQTGRRQSTGAKPNNRKRIVRNSVDGATPKRARKSDLPGPRTNGQDNAILKKEAKNKEEEEQRLAKAKAEEEKRLREAKLEEQRLADERAEEEKRQRNASNGTIDALLAVPGHGLALPSYEEMKKEREDATAVVGRKRIHLAAIRAAFQSLEATIVDELERAEKTLQSANQKWAAVMAIHEAGNKTIENKVIEYERNREKRAREAKAKAAKKQDAAAAVAPHESLLTPPLRPSSSSILLAAGLQVDTPNDPVKEENEKKGRRIVPKASEGKGNGTTDTKGDEEEDQEKGSRKNGDEEPAWGDESVEGQEEETLQGNGIGTPSTPSGPSRPFVTTQADGLADIPYFVHHSPYNPPAKADDSEASPSTSSKGPC